MDQIQNKIYEIYLEIKRICEKNNIRFWAIGGTCLGAVRHQGFIPWDTDMDIAMPDDDYWRFIDIAKKEFENTKYEIKSRLKGDMVTRVFDSETTAISPFNMKYPERYNGVHIDIMPFFGMPESLIHRKIYSFKMGLLHTFDSKRVISFDDNKTIKGKLLWCILSPIRPFTSIDYFYDKWIKCAQKYKYDKSKYTCFLWANYNRAPQLILNTEWFNNWSYLKFEDSVIPCPDDYDDYLKTQYGDYMVLPPENERIMDSDWFIDLKCSYKYYQKHGVEKK